MGMGITENELEKITMWNMTSDFLMEIGSESDF
jgi:hypothetical protein